MNDHPCLRKDPGFVVKIPKILYFYTIMPFKILNKAVKCSRNVFLKAPIQPLLRQTKARTDIFLASA